MEAQNLEDRWRESVGSVYPGPSVTVTRHGVERSASPVLTDFQGLRCFDKPNKMKRKELILQVIALYPTALQLSQHAGRVQKPDRQHIAELIDSMII